MKDLETEPKFCFHSPVLAPTARPGVGKYLHCPHLSVTSCQVARGKARPEVLASQGKEAPLGGLTGLSVLVWKLIRAGGAVCTFGSVLCLWAVMGQLQWDCVSTRHFCGHFG